MKEATDEAREHERAVAIGLGREYVALKSTRDAVLRDLGGKECQIVGIHVRVALAEMINKGVRINEIDPLLLPQALCPIRLSDIVRPGFGGGIGVMDRALHSSFFIVHRLNAFNRCS